ncbi:glycine/D-amino acid oxidase-like deaminating enzyme [Mycoplana sp. BE70]|nr:FAD-dependent oxidoreductase [Mycoplana sp. BE70]MDR6757633.1 glycine/D-amino acid oxidase-like deaminating enzyme [Mycoplana sp. BE70]
MPTVDSRARPAGQPMPDVLVVGAGVMGLWAAVMAARAGHSVLVLERDRVGAGASGGLLGALMPHQPDRWNAKKQFQLQALVSLEAEIAGLETASGLSAGYRRTGRLMPLAADHHRERALKHAGDAATAWTLDGKRFSFDVLDAAPVPGWPATEAMAAGVVFDSLSGHISPRRYLQVLRAVLEGMPHVEIREGANVVSIDPSARTALLADGGRISFGHVVLSAGVSSFDLFSSLGLSPPRPIGTAVKGQAALFRGDIDPALPIIFDSGIFVVPHEGGYCAVGSTSEDSFDDPAATDGRLDEVIAAAWRLAPVLKGATLVERWAGLRPKAIGRDPMIGRHPDFPAVSLLTGGFKISFGIAHELARLVVGEMESGSPCKLPPSFTVDAHLEAARREKP